MYNKLNIQKERHEKSLFKENKMLQTGNDNKAKGNAVKRLASTVKAVGCKRDDIFKTKFQWGIKLLSSTKKKNTYVVEISRGFHPFQYSFGRFIYSFINYAQSYTQFLIQVEVIGAIDDDDVDDGSYLLYIYIYKYINLYVLCDCLCF